MLENDSIMESSDTGQSSAPASSVARKGMSVRLQHCLYVTLSGCKNATLTKAELSSPGYVRTPGM